MAQQGQHNPQAQRPYSPLPGADLHHGPPAPYNPGLKRQQLSPNSQSPYSSPSMANIALPNQVFSSPYYGAQANGNTSQQTYNHQTQGYGNLAATANTPGRPYGNHASPTYSTQNPYAPNSQYTPSSSNVMASNYNTMNIPPSQPLAPPPAQSGSMGVMGPPSRPVDKPTDINELGDVLAGSGVDLREEEAALLSSYRKASQRHEGTYSQNTSGTFGPPYTNQGNFYSHNVPGDRSSFYGAGTFRQAAGPYQSTEEIALSDKQRAQRRKAEIRSFHLNEPFLFAGSLQTRLAKHAKSMQVVISHSGLLHSQTPPANVPPRELIVQGPDKNEVLKLVKGEDLLYTESPYVDFLSLLSLATEERIRGFVEDSATLAKGRRVGSHGVVPAAIADLAAGNKGVSGKSAGLPTPSNSAVSPNSNPLKRSYAEVNAPLTPISDSGSGIRSATTTPNPIAQALQQMARAERAEEEARLEKRRRRNASDAAQSGPVSGAAGIPDIAPDIAPDIDFKKGKAKEQAAAKKQSEAQQHAATTKTMNMALGLSGAMGKKLDWLTKGAQTPSNPYLPKPTTSTPSSRSGPSNTNAPGSSLPKARIFGEFRDDKETGSGIQLRDIISVLENDGKEKRALQRAYARQGGQRR